MDTIKQLRISDDGKSLFIDACLSSDGYGENLFFKDICICTEQEVSEGDASCADKYVYKESFKVPITKTVYDDYQELTCDGEDSIADRVTGFGGWRLDFSTLDGSLKNSIKLDFSVNYDPAEIESGSPAYTTYTFILALEDPAWDPINGMSEGAVTLQGTFEQNHETEEYVIRFNNTGTDDASLDLSKFTDNNVAVNMYVNGIRDGETEEVCEIFPYNRYSEYDSESISFKWQIFSEVYTFDKKAISLILEKADFDAAYNNYNPITGKAIDDTKPIATVAYNDKLLNNHLFFVRIEYTGTLPSDVPCGMDEMVTIGTTYNTKIIYDIGMNYTRELVQDCSIPSGFIDFILSKEALDLSLDTGHYIAAAKHYLGIMGRKTQVSPSKRCGCYG